MTFIQGAGFFYVRISFSLIFQVGTVDLSLLPDKNHNLIYCGVQGERESFWAVSQRSSLHLVSVAGHLATLHSVLIALEAPVVSNEMWNSFNQSVEELTSLSVRLPSVTDCEWMSETNTLNTWTKMSWTWPY